MNNEVIITCAVTGAGDTVGKHPAIPVTPQQIADAAGRGDLTLPIAATFKLSWLGEAHKALAAGARGKIVVLN